MSVVTRGVKNAFRSSIRTTAVVLILAISMGLALSMLLANQAVKDRLEQVKQSVGTTVTVNPAGSKGFQGGGEPLKSDDVGTLKDIGHVKEVSMNLSLMVTTEGDSNMMTKAVGPSGVQSGQTNLVSSIDPGTLGKRFQGRVESNGVEKEIAPEDIKLPIRLLGMSGSKDDNGQTVAVSSGRWLNADDTNQAVAGKKLAEKNSLSLGSTFKAYGEEFTVVGLFDSGTEFGNDAIYIPLATAQRISGAGTEITNAVVTVDSVDNVETATKAIEAKMGNKADVTANEENALTAVESLRSVQKVSMIGFAIALGAAGIIIFLTMLMIVRERRREIGVLKAIGGSNRSIVAQFVVEAIVLVVCGAVLGFGVAAVSSNSIAGALVSSNTSSTTDVSGNDGPRAGGGFRAVQVKRGGEVSSAKDLIGNVTTNISLKSLGYGLLAAVGVAIIGSAIPAWFITKVRPAEVLRGE